MIIYAKLKPDLSKNFTLYLQGDYLKKGDLPHSHMMVELYFEQIIGDEKSFVDDLIRGIIFEIVKTEGFDRFK